MQIEEQIKKLLKLKSKIDLYKKLVTNLQLEKTSKDEECQKLEQEYPGLMGEFCDEIILFCNKRVDFLGNSTTENTVKETRELPKSNEEQLPVNKRTELPTESGEPKDPIKFLLKYKHLDGKKVSFQTEDGEINGVVRGLVTPYIKIITTTGYEVNIEPNKLKVL